MIIQPKLECKIEIDKELGVKLSIFAIKPT